MQRIDDRREKYQAAGSPLGHLRRQVSDAERFCPVKHVSRRWWAPAEICARLTRINVRRRPAERLSWYLLRSLWLGLLV